MKGQIKILKNKSFYFSGIGGVSMSALAKYLIALGKVVMGSDISSSSQTQELESLGVSIDYSQSGKNIKKGQVFVYTSAINESNPEFLKAKSLGLKMVKRSELLGQIVSFYNRSVAVSGSHGKTTCTAMIGEILLKSKISPTIFLGGETVKYGNLYVGKSDVAVVEACEYKQNFLNILPKIAVVLNIDNDHLDSYKNIEEEKNVFERFIKDKIAVINADDSLCMSMANSCSVTFGIRNRANYMAKRIIIKDQKIGFSVYNSGVFLGRINLNIKGRQNVYNALASIAVCDILKIPFKYVKLGLEEYEGVKRRNEKLFDNGLFSIICDYAHHPSEIRALIETYEKYLDETLFIFQPHTYSRTEILMKDFIKELGKCKNLYLYKTYPAREKYNYKGSAVKLFCNLNDGKIKNLRFFSDEKSMIRQIKEVVKNYKKIIFIGAGDIYFIAQKVVGFFK